MYISCVSVWLSFAFSLPACTMYSACFVCVSANVCMCVRHRFFFFFFFNKHTVHSVCSLFTGLPYACVYVYECVETRHSNNLSLSLSFSPFASFFFLHRFICYFISIELAVNAKPLFSFRIEPTFSIPFFVFRTTVAFHHCFNMDGQKHTDFSAPTGEKLPVYSD